MNIIQKYKKHKKVFYNITENKQNNAFKAIKENAIELSVYIAIIASLILTFMTMPKEIQIIGKIVKIAYQTIPIQNPTLKREIYSIISNKYIFYFTIFSTFTVTYIFYGFIVIVFNIYVIINQSLDIFTFIFLRKIVKKIYFKLNWDSLSAHEKFELVAQNPEYGEFFKNKTIGKL